MPQSNKTTNHRHQEEDEFPLNKNRTLMDITIKEREINNIIRISWKSIPAVDKITTAWNVGQGHRVMCLLEEYVTNKYF